MNFPKHIVKNFSDDCIFTFSFLIALLISIPCGIALANIFIILLSNPLIMKVIYTFFVMSSIVALTIFLSVYIESIIDKMKK